MQNKYYINEFREKTTYDITCIGLFKSKTENRQWHGAGNFCGWYGVEYYDNVEMLAWYKFKNTQHSVYEPKGHPHIEENKNVYEFYPKVEIGSIYWEKVIEAETDDEAISKFLKEEF